MVNKVSFTESEEESLKLAHQELMKGRVVAIPTETVYGLAANAFDEQAVNQIFALKKRPAYNPLIVHIGRKEQVEELAQNIPATAHRLMEAFWPGPLTLLLHKKNSVGDRITAGKSTVAIRMPNHRLTLALLQKLPFPLVAPSANRFNHISPTQPEHVRLSLGANAPFILDGGACTLGIESTIIGFSGDKPVLYRWGALSREDIEIVAGPLTLHELDENDIRSPGQLKKHYAPHTAMEICSNIPRRLKSLENQRVGLLLWTRRPALDHEPQMVLSPRGDLNEAAHHLFAALHRLDQMDLDMILAEPVPDRGVGQAINDRLRKASAR